MDYAAHILYMYYTVWLKKTMHKKDSFYSSITLQYNPIEVIATSATIIISCIHNTTQVFWNTLFNFSRFLTHFATQGSEM